MAEEQAINCKFINKLIYSSTSFGFVVEIQDVGLQIWRCIVIAKALYYERVSYWWNKDPNYIDEYCYNRKFYY